MTLALKNAIVQRDVAHLVFPDEVQTVPAGDAKASGPEGRLGETTISPPPEALRQALARIGRARRPLIIVGYGARDGMAAVVRLAERLKEFGTACNHLAELASVLAEQAEPGPRHAALRAEAWQALSRADDLLPRLGSLRPDRKVWATRAELHARWGSLDEARAALSTVDTLPAGHLYDASAFIERAQALIRARAEG